MKIPLSQIEQNIKKLLEEKPELRSIKKRRELIWEYWKKYDGLPNVITKPMWLYRLTGTENITRSARKVQSKFKNLDDPNRYVQAEERREYYKSEDDKWREFSKQVLS